VRRFETIAGTVPVFPLPNTVFFPETVLPLHVFEERYRAMVRDAVDGDGRIAVTLLRPGWESDYYGAPPVHATATLGRIENLVRLADGRFNLRLVGLERIRLHDEVRDAPYRVVRYATAPERQPDDPARIEAAKMELLATQMCVARELAGNEAPEPFIDGAVSLAAAVNGACSSLPLDAAVRQALLEEDDLLERRDKVAAILDQILEQLVRVRGQRPARDPDGGDEPLHRAGQPPIWCIVRTGRIASRRSRMSSAPPRPLRAIARSM
jgi:Lon protease-like protein